MKRELSSEMRNAIVWLERRAGVTSVVQGRYTRGRHKHKPGFVRTVEADARHVHLRLFDKEGSKELFVYAPPSSQRDTWVAQLATGDPFKVLQPSGNGQQPARKTALPTVTRTVAASALSDIHRPSEAPSMSEPSGCSCAGSGVTLDWL